MLKGEDTLFRKIAGLLSELTIGDIKVTVKLHKPGSLLLYLIFEVHIPTWQEVDKIIKEHID